MQKKKKKKKISTDDDNGIAFNKNIIKPEIIAITLENIEKLLMIFASYKILKEIPVVFRNGSTYDYHFIVNVIAKEFKGQFECLGDNTEKYITFSVPINKELDYGKSIKYKIKFIDSFRFMSTSLSKLVKYLSERLHSDKCIDCKSDLDYMSVKDDQLIFRCFECKKNYKKDFNKELIKRFANTCEFCNGDINKFIIITINLFCY